MSEEIVKIESIIRNTRKYWYVDGLSEIAGGLIIFSAGLTYWLVSTLENIGIKAVNGCATGCDYSWFINRPENPA